MRDALSRREYYSNFQAEENKSRSCSRRCGRSGICPVFADDRNKLAEYQVEGGAVRSRLLRLAGQEQSAKVNKSRGFTQFGGTDVGLKNFAFTRRPLVAEELRRWRKRKPRGLLLDGTAQEDERKEPVPAFGN